MIIKAVIPIRKGSQRVQNKNLRPFADTTLLENKIKVLKKAGFFDDIIVDSEEAIAMAEANGVSWHRREPYYASSACSGSEFFQHLGIVTDCDVFCYCPVTSPFVSVETMMKCKALYEEKMQEGCDCVSTVSDVKEFLWLDGKPVNYDKENAPNSQNLPDVKALNFGFTMVKRESLIKNRNIIGDNPLFVTTSGMESVDIDTPLDFYIAEQIYRKVILEGKNILD